MQNNKELNRITAQINSFTKQQIIAAGLPLHLKLKEQLASVGCDKIDQTSFQTLKMHGGKTKEKL